MVVVNLDSPRGRNLLGGDTGLGPWIGRVGGWPATAP
jgi:hypothetical protein